jgi:hypothetical protein
VKGALADVVRRLESGEMDTRRANALVYALSTLAGVMTTSDLEERVAELERAQAGAGRTGLAS